METTPVVDNTPVINNTPTVETAPVVEATPVVETAPIINNTPTVETAPVVKNKFEKLNIIPENIPDKKVTDCNLNELITAISNIVSENAYQYINKALGNDITIQKLNDNPSKEDCAKLLNSIPLTINFEKWIETETELEKNNTLYKKASDWVTSEIRNNSRNPKYAMGRSDVIIGLYRKYYNSTDEELTKAKTTADKTNDTTETTSKPKKTRTSKKKSTTTDTTTAIEPTAQTVNPMPAPVETPVETPVTNPLSTPVTNTEPTQTTINSTPSTDIFDW